MAYSHSFSPEFYFAEGEPYDRSDNAVNSKGQPISLWSALNMLKESDPENWKCICIDCFPATNWEHVTVESILELAKQVDTCSNLDTPVHVWIDCLGYYTVDVYDER
jgi:hypothetical protein